MSSRESQHTWGIHTYMHTQIHTVQKYTCKTGSHTKSLATLGSHMSACTHEVIPQVTGSNRLHWENISGRVVCSAMLMKAPYSPHFPLWWAKLFNYRGKPCPEDSALSAGKCWAGQGQRRIPWHWSHTTVTPEAIPLGETAGSLACARHLDWALYLSLSNSRVTSN